MGRGFEGMSSCRALAARLRQIAAGLPVAQLQEAASRAEDAAVALLTAQGSHETVLAVSAKALRDAASTMTASAGQLVHAANWMELYCTDILGVAAPGAVPPQPMPASVPDVLAPLPAHLDEHLFRGHSRHRRVTGYHHRHGGLDRGRMRISDRTPVDAHGIYWAEVSGPTSGGRHTRKRSGSTFFPDTWSMAEVRRAVRDAFAHRRQVWDDDGDLVPNMWEGQHQGIIIQGYLFPGTEFSTATEQDIGTAYPVRRTPPPAR